MTPDPPVNNAPYLSHVHDGLTIEGWSRAAVQSYWRIPELNIGFDFGAQPWDFMGTSTWFVSHTHLDHIAALPVYVARRRMMKMDPPTIYVPEEAVEDVNRLMKIFHKLDRGRQSAEIKGIKAGQTIPLGRQLCVTAFQTAKRKVSRADVSDEDLEGDLDEKGELDERVWSEWQSWMGSRLGWADESKRAWITERVRRQAREADDRIERVLTQAEEADERIEHIVTTHPTAHTIPSLGFVVYEVRKKLMEKYLGLPGAEVKKLRLEAEAKGESIIEEKQLPLIAYTGDTSPEGLDNNPAFFDAKILITEMSFIRASHRRDKIHKFGHMHLDDFAERAGLFKNELIIASHFSTRYHPNEVRKLLDGKLPKELKDRMKLWV